MNMTTPYHKKPCSLNLEIFIISTDSHSYHFSWKLSQGRFLKKQCICIYTLCLCNIIIPVSGHALAQERWFQESWLFIPVEVQYAQKVMRGETHVVEITLIQNILPPNLASLEHWNQWILHFLVDLPSQRMLHTTNWVNNYLENLIGSVISYDKINN